MKHPLPKFSLIVNFFLLLLQVIRRLCLLQYYVKKRETKLSQFLFQILAKERL